MGVNKVSVLCFMPHKSWDTFLSSDHSSIGVVNGVKVMMKKPALGVGLLIKQPSLYLPRDPDRQPQLPDQNLKDSDQSSQLAA